MKKKKQNKKIYNKKIIYPKRKIKLIKKRNNLD